MKKKLKELIEKLEKKIDSSSYSFFDMYRNIKEDIQIYLRVRKTWKVLKELFKDIPELNVNMSSWRCELYVWSFAAEEKHTAIQIVHIINERLLNNGFTVSDKFSFSSRYYLATYYLEKHITGKGVEITIYNDDKCEIEYVDVVKKEAKLVGLCAEVLNEITLS